MSRRLQPAAVAEARPSASASGARWLRLTLETATQSPQGEPLLDTAPRPLAGRGHRAARTSRGRSPRRPCFLTQYPTVDGRFGRSAGRSPPATGPGPAASQRSRGPCHDRCSVASRTEKRTCARPVLRPRAAARSTELFSRDSVRDSIWRTRSRVTPTSRADLLERHRAAVGEAVAQLEHPALAPGQRLEHLVWSSASRRRLGAPARAGGRSAASAMKSPSGRRRRRRPPGVSSETGSCPSFQHLLDLVRRSSPRAAAISAAVGSRPSVLESFAPRARRRGSSARPCGRGCGSFATGRRGRA